jgi:hypothetical protein
MRDTFSTSPIEGLEELTSFDNQGGTGIADGVRIQTMPIGSDGEVALAITWFEECFEDLQESDREPLNDATAYFKMIRLSPGGSGLPKITVSGAVVNLGPTDDLPFVIPSNHPFLVEGFERESRIVSADETSGFYVITRPRESVAIRVSVLDGRRVDSSESIRFGSSEDRTLAAEGAVAPDELFVYELLKGSIERATFTCE